MLTDETVLCAFDFLNWGDDSKRTVIRATVFLLLNLFKNSIFSRTGFLTGLFLAVPLEPFFLLQNLKGVCLMVCLLFWLLVFHPLFCQIFSVSLLPRSQIVFIRRRMRQFLGSFFLLTKTTAFIF